MEEVEKDVFGAGVAECPFYGPTSVFPVGLLLKAPNNHDEDSD